MTEEDVITCISEGVNIVHISIDASNPETYRKIRGADLERVIDVLRQFKKYKLEQKKNIPQINVNYTLFSINSEELLPFIKRYEEFIDCIRVGTYIKKYEELPFDRPDPDTVRRVIDDARRLCESENIEIHTAYETKSVTRKRLCSVPLSYLNINSKGELRVCSDEVIGNLLKGDSYVEIEKRNLSKIKDLIHMKNQYCQIHCYSA
jgi:MoaA/NifB/PqqE/SkfB family radical SAM enzyme